MAHLTRTQDGFNLLGLASDQVELWLAPELGGKWVSLFDRAQNREWMWSPTPARQLFRAPDANAFHTSCLIGADECIPTIAPASWQGRALPDHGEVWNLPWSVLPDSPPNSISLQIDFPISPLRLTRTIHLDAATLTVDYHLENLGAITEPFVWAFHPLLAIQSGDILELPTSIRDLLLESTPDGELGGRGTVCSWPSPRPGMDISQLDLGGGNRAAKFFTRPLLADQNWARIVNPVLNTSLTYTFVPTTITTIGIWLTRGGWNGFHHLAIEPGIGAPDPLDVACNDWQHVGTVSPSGQKSWQFQLQANE